MRKAVNQPPTEKTILRRCAVFKIDLTGRFVYVDELTEQLLGLAGENLFGRSIEEFLDSDSYSAVLSVLHDARRYETFYKTADLVFMNAENVRRKYNVIISLCFIGGNPANYQFIVNPCYQGEMVQPGYNNENDIAALLFDYLSNLKEHIEWESLFSIILDTDDIEGIGSYKYENGELIFLAASPEDFAVSGSIDFAVTGQIHKMAAEHIAPHLNKELTGPEFLEDSGDAEIMESCYPLVHRGNCWGLLRLVHHGDITTVGFNLTGVIQFLGNALFSFVYDVPVERGKLLTSG
jgi:hypothetical protein